MNILEYIKRFRLDQENFNFSREEFMQEFGKDFLEELNRCLNSIPGNEYTDRNKIFRDVVDKFHRKFRAISDLKSGKPFSQGFWNAFYAIHVIPARSKIYSGHPSIRDVAIIKFTKPNPINTRQKIYQEP